MSSILAPGIHEYLGSFREEADPLLTRLEAEARAERIPILPPESAQFLELIARMVRPERALEIGTATGYSAIRLARAMPAWSNLDTIEIDMDIADRAWANFGEAGLQSRVNILRGPALQLLPQLQHRFDLVFIDAKKSEYLACLTLALKLMPKGACVLIDNLLWSGRVATGHRDDDPTWRREATDALVQFNEAFLDHPELQAQILPIGDGMGLGVKV
ncbi:MAG: O-methyltransferase [Planctomycetota bacterium]|jgi:predicted O-methyltransferase YrrM